MWNHFKNIFIILYKNKKNYNFLRIIYFLTNVNKVKLKLFSGNW